MGRYKRMRPSSRPWRTAGRQGDFDNIPDRPMRRAKGNKDNKEINAAHEVAKEEQEVGRGRMQGTQLQVLAWTRHFVFGQWWAAEMIAGRDRTHLENSIF